MGPGMTWEQDLGTPPYFLLLVEELDVTLPATAAPREQKAWDSAASGSIPDARWETNPSQEINHPPPKARVAFQCQRELCCSPGGCHPASAARASDGPPELASARTAA